MQIQDAAHAEPIYKEAFFRAFRYRNFALFFSGQTISLIGTWSQALALSWLVWRLTHSAMWLGVIGFVTQIPMLVLGLPGGAVADRFDRLRLLIIMQTLCMMQAVVLAALTLTGAIQIWHIFVAGAMLGVVYAFEFPLRLSFMTDMVGKQDLLNAVSFNAAMFHFTRIAGPVAAGVIVAWSGEGVCFLFNALTFIALIIALMFIKRQDLFTFHHEHRPFLHSILEGLRYMWNKPSAKLSIFLVILVSAVGMSFIYLMPIFADKIFGGGSVQLGWLMGASGIGALLGALWLANRKTNEKLLSLSARASVFFAIAITAFSLMSNIWMALPLLSIAGFFLTIVFSGINTLLQHSTPDYLRGRMMSLFSTAFMGFGPFSSLLGGFLAKEIGAPRTVTACGILSAMIGILILIKAKKLDGNAILSRGQ